jgi:hypothetical protein
MTTAQAPLLSKPSPSYMRDSVVVEDNEASEADTEFESKWSNWSVTRRFGLTILICLPLAFLGILAPLAFLWYLWTSHANNEVWRRIMAEGFCTRVVTLLSMVLRTAIIFLSMACTSMLAAFILERGLLVLSKAAALSAIRYINGGPLNLLLLFFGGTGFKRKFVTGLFVSVFLFTTILTQFTSTALLSDIRPGLVPGGYQSSQLPFRLNESYTGLDASDIIDIEGLWSNKPPFYPMFAEYAESPTPYQDDGTISDTGITLRAFLPLPFEQNRTLVRNYTGPGIVFDSRVICMRPEVNIFQFIDLGDFEPEDQTLGAIDGIIQVTATAPGVYNADSPTAFICTVIFTPDDGASEWAVTVCSLGLGTPGVLVSPFQDPNTLNLTSPGPGYIDGTMSYLVINTTGTLGDWQVAVGNTTTPPWSYIAHGEWLDAIPGNRSTDAKLSLSVCYASTYAVDTQINAFSPTQRTEPSIVWDIQQGAFDSQAVRQQLGATIPVASQQDRGIMALQSRPSWTISPNNTQSALTFEEEDLWYGWTTFANTTLNFCLSCFCCSETTDLTWVSDRYLATVFQAIFQDTQKPALALQAYITTLFQIGYYAHVQEFGMVAPTTWQSFVSVQVPSGFTGLSLVTCVLMVELVLVSIAITLFQTRTRYSMLGNSWQGATQTYSPETVKIHNTASVLSDTEVEKLLESEGMGTTRVALGRLDTRRIAVVAVD